MKTINKHGSKQGFTLIELLVVISIIALLVGILLPALGAARRSAQSAVCLGNMRSAGQALATYAANNRDWMPGPNTSGAKIVDGYTWGSNSNEPTQNMDWISASMGDSLGLPGNVGERIVKIFNNDMYCPANDAYYTDERDGTTPPGTTPESLRVNSYGAILGFQWMPYFATGIDQNKLPQVVKPDGKAKNAVVHNASYRPRVDLVGAASNKVYAMDGTRYMEGNEITYNGYPWQDEGGNFMTSSPAIANGGDPYQYESNSNTPTDNSVRYAYRHNMALNAVFFDGHGANMKPDEATNLDLYFPSGSEVRSLAQTVDYDYQGSVIR